MKRKCTQWWSTMSLISTSKLLQNIKYVLNTMTIWVPMSTRKAGRQHVCCQNQHTRRLKVKERENQRQTMVDIRKLKFEQQEPHYNWSLTHKLKMVNKVLFNKWHSWCCWRQQPVICHTWWQVMHKDKWNDLQSVQTKDISLHSWNRLDKG
jgi:hypothetical protein